MINFDVKKTYGCWGWMFADFFLLCGGADLPCCMGKTFVVRVGFQWEAFLLIKF
jgi:hypothetical protein